MTTPVWLLGASARQAKVGIFMSSAAESRLRIAALGVGAVTVLFYFSWNLLRFFPNGHGHLGHDYGEFLPWMIAGLHWQVVNGAFSVPEFMPAFCAGSPFVFNPQSSYFSLPQLLVSALAPLPSFYVSWIIVGLIGGAGMVGLLRQAFRTSWEAAFVGGGLFLLNGYFFFRMVIGHITFHPFMLVPAMVWTLMPATVGSRVSAAQIGGRSVLLAALIAYSFYCGGIYTLLTVPLMWAALLAIAFCVDRLHRSTVTILLIGSGLGIGLCAYRLLPAMAYLANFPRSNAMLLGNDLLRIVLRAAEMLFIPQILPRLDQHQTYGLRRHELEYGVGLVPLLLLLAVAVVACLRGSVARAKRRLPAQKWMALLVLLLCLSLPILLSFKGLGLGFLYAHIPIIKSMSVMFRFWSVYIPILCVASALALDFLFARPVVRLAAALGAVLLTIAQSAMTNTAYYNAEIYDPAPMLQAFTQIRAGNGLPQISRVVQPQTADNFFWNDGFVAGVTGVPCYEPMFGYDGQSFPKGRIEVGPVLQVSNGLLNLKNPVCDVFPGANACRPGDEFSEAQRAEAEAFTRYRPFNYRWPAWQYAATTVTIVSATLAVVLGVYSLFARPRRAAHR